MRKIAIIIAVLALLPVFACAQTVSTDPVTITWSGESLIHEVAIQNGTDEIISLGIVPIKELYIDLKPLNHYGAFVILVRGVNEVNGIPYYSEWIRSDVDEDVIIIDGVAQTIILVNVAKPTMLRIK